MHAKMLMVPESAGEVKLKEKSENSPHPSLLLAATAN